MEHGTPEWHAQRRKSVGASEAYDIVVGRLHRLWQRKTQRDMPEPESDDARFGKMMEDAVLSEYERVTGQSVERQRHFSALDHGRATATPDGVVWPALAPSMARGNPERVVEVKCPRYSRGWGPAGSQAVPPRVFWQIQQQMAVTGAPVADVVALLHREVRIYRDLPAHAEAQHLLLTEIEHFWATYVLPDREPPPDDSEQCASYLARLYPIAPEDRTMQACEDAEVAQAARDYARAKRACDDAEADKRRAKAVLASRIGNAYGLEGAWGSVALANVAGRKRVDHAALCLGILRKLVKSDDAARRELADLEQQHTTTGGGYRRLDVNLKEAE